ncbi:MAG: DUF4145 domain-containing protein [Candidatus Aenigmarchaeota archaeon]|nr:DUF4145 domain-containing protein [Candidatus Aenigmarchaeota archaeon]
MRSVPKTTFDRIENLIEEGHILEKACPSIDELHDGDDIDLSLETKYTEWSTSSLNFLRYFFGINHFFIERFRKNLNVKYVYTQTEPNGSSIQKEVLCVKEKMSKLRGVLMSIKKEVEMGYSEDVTFLHKRESLSDILEDGFVLLEHDYKVAAAIYGRIILENTIKELCKLKGVDIEKNENFSSMLLKLRQIKTIDLPQERSYQAQYDIGSLAAHGKEDFNKKTKRDILDMLNFIRDNVLQLK